VGLKRVVEQREMAWLWIERYHDPNQMEKIIFLPLLCQHCENAPCEPVCPVFAAHHSNEGLNNQIYNRCVGTRFCSQNCPYKARRFNWFDWDRPRPLNLQLNPDVTVRSKGVMEKCSFCNQRIKEAHDNVSNRCLRFRQYYRQKQSRAPNGGRQTQIPNYGIHEHQTRCHLSEKSDA
jgi:molybdopterin-containing oxidoreductase family iron-sulfur binding subunit